MKSPQKISIDRLAAFETVVRTGSIAAAAIELGVDESTIQKRLSDLELALGCPLKHFTKQGIELTDAGSRLLSIARELSLGLTELSRFCRAQPIPIRIGGGDRLLHWIILPRLAEIQRLVPTCQIELHNGSTRVVVERVTNLTLDLGIVRFAEAESDLVQARLPIPFDYALFVQDKLLPRECDGNWVVQHAPLAVVAKYQNELQDVAAKQGITLNVQLICSTFPQARHAVTSGYAAILPRHAFVSPEPIGVREFALPFKIPEFESTESNLALVWNQRSEKIRPAFRQVLDAFKKVLIPKSDIAAPRPKET